MRTSDELAIGIKLSRLQRTMATGAKAPVF